MPPASYRGSIAEACNRLCSRGDPVRLRHALSSLLQVCQHFLSVPLGLYRGEYVLDPSVRPDDERGACDSHHFLAIHVFLLHHSESFGDFLVNISQQAERKVELVLEFFLCLGSIGRDPEDHSTRLLNLFIRVAEPARFHGSTGRIRSRIEIEDYSLPAEVLRRNISPVLVLQSKLRGFIINIHANLFS